MQCSLVSAASTSLLPLVPPQPASTNPGKGFNIGHPTTRGTCFAPLPHFHTTNRKHNKKTHSLPKKRMILDTIDIIVVGLPKISIPTISHLAALLRLSNGLLSLLLLLLLLEPGRFKEVNPCGKSTHKNLPVLRQKC